MCGIAGIYSNEGRTMDERILRRMAAAIAHRGPDGEGIHVDDSQSPSVGLVSRRLAVIDIPGGRQPMSSEDGRYTIVYNGEIFNADSVRKDLESRGHGFRSRCDTEVVLRGYMEWGEAVLERLNGMWAIAVWDRAKRRLFLARDRLGVKPLVYAETPDGFVFASEIKALTASGLVARQLNAEALPYYLSFFAVPEPYSLVRGVRRLPAGHSLTIDSAGARERQYWDCNLPEEEDQGREAYREEIETLLDDSVHRRLVSDVPLGVLLSSGVDSSVVSALAARHVDGPLRTFTLGFGDAASDERAPARSMARMLGAQHTEDQITSSRAAAALPDLLDAYDEPGQSLLQTHFVSELARRDVTVALSGLGGDELFSAYPTHVVANLFARLDGVPGPLREAVVGAAALAPSSRLRRAAALARMGADERATVRLMHQTGAELRHSLLSADLCAAVDFEAPARHLEAHFERATGQHPLNRMLYVYLKTYLPDELLRASDAMSMLHSLELRTPFLDYRLVERAMRIPARHKMAWKTGKLLLRDVGEHVLPSHLSATKMGFSLPLAQWLRGDLQESVRDVLGSTAIAERGIFDPVVVDRIVKDLVAGDDRLVQPVMMLYCFESWARRWLDEPAGAKNGQVPSPITVTDSRQAPSTDLSVVVVNWNTRERLHDCLASLESHLSGVAHEVIVVDNASSDGSPDMVEERFPAVRLIRNEDNVGFGRANNQAMRVAHGKWFLLLNSDTELFDESVADLFASIEHEQDIGVAHCSLQFPDGRQQHSTYRFPSLKLALLEDLGLYKFISDRRAGEALLSGYWDYDEERDVDWVAGAFMLMPRAVFEATNGFDERLFMYGEDLEWCQRIRDHGWRIRFFPQASVTHYDHTSSDIRWGDERVALCLMRQRDIYQERNGLARTSALMGIRIIGATLRTAYYSVRSHVGPRAGAYRDMRKFASQSLAALLPLLLRR